MPPLKPQIVYRDGKPCSVILDIEVFEALLDELDELDDIRAVEEALKEPLDTVAFDEYLAQLQERREAEARAAVQGRIASDGEAAA